MELKARLTPDKIKDIENSVETIAQDGSTVVIDVVERHSPTGIDLHYEDGTYFVSLGPCRRQCLTEKGFVSGLSNNGHRVTLYDETRNNCPSR